MAPFQARGNEIFIKKIAVSQVKPHGKCYSREIKMGGEERGRERKRHGKQRGKEMEKQRQVDREERLRGRQMTETEGGPETHGLLELEGAIVNVHKPLILQIRKLRQRKSFARVMKVFSLILSQEPRSWLPIGLKEEELERDKMGEGREVRDGGKRVRERHRETIFTGFTLSGLPE